MDLIYLVGILIAIPLLLYIAKCVDDEWFGEGMCILPLSLSSWIIIVLIFVITVYYVIKNKINGKEL